MLARPVGDRELRERADSGNRHPQERISSRASFPIGQQHGGRCSSTIEKRCQSGQTAPRRAGVRLLSAAERPRGVPALLRMTAGLVLPLVALGCAATSSSASPHAVAHPSSASPQGPRSTAVDSTQAPAASWPGIRRLDAPPTAVDCTPNSSDPALSWQRGEQAALRLSKVLPRYFSIQEQKSSMSVLPFQSIPALVVNEEYHRSIVSVSGGWLVAIKHQQSQEGGLYWVAQGSSEAKPIESGSLAGIRWLMRTSFGIVGIGGTCSGDACALETAVYSIERSGGDSLWTATPRGAIAGCPAAVGAGVDEKSVLVATGCGTVYQIGKRAMASVASWPRHLLALEIQSEVANLAAATEERFYLSFGRVAATLTARHSEWYVPRECATVRQGSGERCQCVPSER